MATTEAAPGSAFPVDLDDAGKEILHLVSTSDLSELTSAKVRVHLKTKFGVDFDAFKKKVNDLTRCAIEENEKLKKKRAESDSDSDSDGDEPVRKNTNNDDDDDDKQQNGSKANESDSDSDPGVLSTGRKLKGKKSKASTSNDHNDDDDDMISTIKTSRRAAATKAKNNIKKSAGYGGGGKSSKKRGAEKDEGPKIEGKVGLKTKLVYCSPLLQEITDKAYMKRCDVVKSLWDYIKANNLQDPKKKATIRCDEKLNALMKRKTVNGFGMVKYLVNHILMPHELGPEYEAEAKEELMRMREDYLRRVREAEENGGVAAAEEPAEKKAKVEKEEEEEEDDEDEKEEEEEEEEKKKEESEEDSD